MCLFILGGACLLYMHLRVTSIDPREEGTPESHDGVPSDEVETGRACTHHGHDGCDVAPVAVVCNGEATATATARVVGTLATKGQQVTVAV